MVSKIAWTLLLRLVCFINTITIIAEISKGSKLVISVKRTVVFYIWCFGLFIFKLRSLSQKDVNVISTHNSQFSHSFDRMIQVTLLPSSYQGSNPSRQRVTRFLSCAITSQEKRLQYIDLVSFIRLCRTSRFGRNMFRHQPKQVK